MSKSADSIIPSGITRNHILQAMEEFDRDGMPAGFKPSHRYDVIHEERAYPPPAILALSIKGVMGKLPPPVIRAGKGTHCFSIFEACGFEVVRKNK